MVTADVLNCIDVGDCLVMTKSIYQISIASYAAAALLFLIVIIILWRTPAMVFLKAWLTGKPVIYITNRSQQGKFITSKNKYEGMADIRGLGPVMISENSHTIERTSGRPLYFIFAEFAATVPLWFAAIITDLKKKFNKDKDKLTNSEDLGEKIGLKYDVNSGKWVTQKPKTKNENINIKAFQTFKLHDLANMFPFNVTPAMIESRIVHAIAAKQKFWNALNPQAMFLIIALLIAGTLAGVIAWKFMGGGVPEVKVTIDQAGQILVANYTG